MEIQTASTIIPTAATTTTTTTTPVIIQNQDMNNNKISIEFQIFPHSDSPLHRQDHSNRPFLFTPVEVKLRKGNVVHIGRKIDRSKDIATRGTTREDRAAHNVSVDPSHMSTGALSTNTTTNTTNAVAVGETGAQRPGDNPVTVNGNLVMFHEPEGQIQYQFEIEADLPGDISGGDGMINRGDSNPNRQVPTNETSLAAPQQIGSLGLQLGHGASLDIQNINSVNSVNTNTHHNYITNNSTTNTPDGEIVSSPPNLKDSSQIQCIAFRSKVVSRYHAEISIGQDGLLYFRDVGSSSGSFLNRLRLSASGKESQLHQLKSGDIIQLGVDYQGRQEEIYKAVMMKIFINSKKNQPVLANKQRLNRALRALIHSMNPNSKKEDEVTVECCICINSMSPFQALFLAPCSHCFHYKCVTTLLGAGFMFQCPLCRQVANLEASVAEPDDATEMEFGEQQDEQDDDSQDDDMMDVEVGVQGSGDDIVVDTTNASQVEQDPNQENPKESKEVGASAVTLHRGSRDFVVGPSEPHEGPISRSGSMAVTIPVTNPGTGTALRQGDGAALSPSTPHYTSVMPVRGASPLGVSFNGGMRRPEVSVEIFNTITRLAGHLSRGDVGLIEGTMEEYAEQMLVLMRGVGGSEERARELMGKVGSVLGNKASLRLLEPELEPQVQERDAMN